MLGQVAGLFDEVGEQLNAFKSVTVQGYKAQDALNRRGKKVTL